MKKPVNIEFYGLSNDIDGFFAERVGLASLILSTESTVSKGFQEIR
jgi:hypothetical protein